MLQNKQTEPKQKALGTRRRTMVRREAKFACSKKKQKRKNPKKRVFTFKDIISKIYLRNKLSYIPFFLAVWTFFTSPFIYIVFVLLYPFQKSEGEYIRR